MLQWMGGSRRKVTSSRKSTHKRQRQYFEQRKRQQLQTADFESYADGNHSCNQQLGNNRSLDILSLLSVSTVSHKQNPSCPDEMDDSENDDDFTLNHQKMNSPLAIQTSEPLFVDQFEHHEQGTSSSYHTENEFSKKFPGRSPDHNENMDGHSKKLDCFNSFGAHRECQQRLALFLHPKTFMLSYLGCKISRCTICEHSHEQHSPFNHQLLPCFRSNLEYIFYTENSAKLILLCCCISPELSVLDLLGDGGANENAETHLVHSKEAHVAFSIEGLGKVETETPVHSPEMPGRSLLNGFDSPRKARRKPLTMKYLDDGFDNLESLEDVVMPVVDTYDNFTEQSFCPSDLANILDNPNHKFFNYRKSLPSNSQISHLEGACGDDVPFFRIRERGRNIWNGPSFLEDTEYLGERELFFTNSAHPRDDSFDDFGNWNQNKRSSRTSTERTIDFDLPVLPTPYSKHQIPDDLPDLKLSDTSCRYSTISIENGIKGAGNCFVDDPKESSSLVSEESCSSTAVRGDATKTS